MTNRQAQEIIRLLHELTALAYRQTRYLAQLTAPDELQQTRSWQDQQQEWLNAAIDHEDAESLAESEG